MEQYIHFNILGNRDEVSHISFGPAEICPLCSLAIDGSMGFGEFTMSLSTPVAPKVHAAKKERTL